MDRDDLADLFSYFGPVSLQRMFSGYGIAADGVNFAMSLRTGIILRVDDQTVGRFEAEGAKPFQYRTRNRTVVVNSYRHLPERLYDDPEELAVWAREAVGAAQRAKAKKKSRKPGDVILMPAGPAGKTRNMKRKKPATAKRGKPVPRKTLRKKASRKKS
ncbi:MAG: TfoX family protein [Bradyrhizobiaceae bacterium]|nr:MAG: TfoX family protein [Bradyrhizobiaceae bacterium]